MANNEVNSRDLSGAADSDDGSSEAENEVSSPPKRKKRDSNDAGPSCSNVNVRKFAGAARFKTKFNSSWTKKWPCIVEVAGSQHEFKCTLCSKVSSCGHQGEADVCRHLNGAKHKERAKNASSSRRLSECGFRAENDPIKEQVIRAETKVSLLLAENNIQMAFADKLSDIFKDIFPDSTIAKEYASKRTKASCILNQALAPHFLKKTVEVMQNDYFSLSTDGSNDTDIEKMNPLTVRLYDVNTHRTVTRFLDMCCTSGEDCGLASTIFNTIDSKMMEHAVPWSNCVGFSVDNTSVNLGAHNSILSRVLIKNPSCYFMGCPCHIIHNTAHKGAEAFASVTGFDVEDFCIDLFYYFDKSTKRKGALQSYNEFCDQEYRKILKHVNVRWLSLERAVERALKQYEGLKSYFLSESEPCPRFKRLKKHFQSPLTEVYLLFYNAIMPSFTTINRFLQREDPCIYLVHEMLERFIKQLMAKFITLDAIKSAEDLTKVDITKYKDTSLMFIGIVTKTRVNKLFDEGDITKTEKDKFLDGVLQFYCSVTKYALDKLPLNDKVLMHSVFVNFTGREKCEFEDVEFFVKQFKLNDSPKDLNELQEEFLAYQLLNASDIPKLVWDDACIIEKEDGEEVTRYYRMDVIWGYLSTMKAGDGQFQFKRLFKVAKLILVLPHSNAGEERVFSMVRKNKTPFRSSLSMEGTLSSILTVKLADVNAIQFKPSRDLLKKAKSATWEYNKQHKQKK